ncbi:MAG: ATP-binding cassette domain-containing protein, partial [Candidatus Dormibacteria bacterium]
RVGEREITALGDGDRASFRRGVGFVFQRFHLLPALTALDNVLAPLIPYRVDFERTARARELLQAVGLGGRGNDLPSHLSGGEQQRLAIARALISRPGIVLADEPTGNLDSANGTIVMDLLLRLRREHGFTLLIATHDLSISERCERMVQLSDGRVASTKPGFGEGSKP